MFDFKSDLNPSQLAAVTTINGPVLVIAGAGSGKTRVIEYRVLHLVQNNVNPKSILLLTFTRKAAKEMLARAAGHDPQCRYVEGGTFHSFGYRKLRKHAKLIGLSNKFSVLDEGDAEEAVQRCCNKLGLGGKGKRFPKKNTLKNIISMSINQGITIEEVLGKEYAHFLTHTPEITVLKGKYAEYKLEKNYLDYDDLLVYLRKLITDPMIRNEIANQYQYIMIDEYQDTNKLQGDVVYSLGATHKNIMIVGDDAQSIYGFRGTSHENIMLFPKQFPDCKIIKLEENYRSTQSVLDVANSVLASMDNKYSKCLTAVNKSPGDKPVLTVFENIYAEAEYVAEKIAEITAQGTPTGRMSVLYRSSYLSIPIQAELAKRNIAYQVFGGLRFHELAHVKDMLAHLKILINHKDELSWTRVLMLIEGIGPRTSERILEGILASPDLSQAFKKYKKDSKHAGGLGNLETALTKTSRDKITVGEQFEIILDYYKPLLEEKFDDWPRRINDLDILREVFARYDSLDDVLADLAIEPMESGRAPSATRDESTLTLSTIHSAKGLEWEVVFLIGVVDGYLPISFAFDDEDEIEEERRLFYVAITRAKRHLFLSQYHESVKGGLLQYNRLSRFVDLPHIMSKLEQQVLTKPETKGFYRDRLW